MDLGYGAWRRLYIVVIHSSKLHLNDFGNVHGRRQEITVWCMKMNKNKRSVGYGILRHSMLQPHFLADLGLPIPGDGGVDWRAFGGRGAFGVCRLAHIIVRLCVNGSPCVQGVRSDPMSKRIKGQERRQGLQPSFDYAGDRLH